MPDYKSYFKRPAVWDVYTLAVTILYMLWKVKVILARFF
jgi:hypothetical protein